MWFCPPTDEWANPVTVAVSVAAMLATVRFPVSVVAPAAAFAVKVSTPPPVNVMTCPDSSFNESDVIVRVTPDPTVAVPLLRIIWGRRQP